MGLGQRLALHARLLRLGHHRRRVRVQLCLDLAQRRVVSRERLLIELALLRGEGDGGIESGCRRLPDGGLRLLGASLPPPLQCSPDRLRIGRRCSDHDLPLRAAARHLRLDRDSPEQGLPHVGIGGDVVDREVAAAGTLHPASIRAAQRHHHRLRAAHHHPHRTRLADRKAVVAASAGRDVEAARIGCQHGLVGRGRIDDRRGLRGHHRRRHLQRQGTHRGHCEGRRRSGRGRGRNRCRGRGCDRCPHRLRRLQIGRRRACQQGAAHSGLGRLLHLPLTLEQLAHLDHLADLLPRPRRIGAQGVLRVAGPHQALLRAGEVDVTALPLAQAFAVLGDCRQRDKQGRDDRGSRRCTERSGLHGEFLFELAVRGQWG
ncbi:MAG: hypothetical protein ING46_02135 [Rubrivivax sp.]|nr:hypothetical protein [Rubrivivax sp.]